MESLKTELKMEEAKSDQLKENLISAKSSVLHPSGESRCQFEEVQKALREDSAKLNKETASLEISKSLYVDTIPAQEEVALKFRLAAIESGKEKERELEAKVQRQWLDSRSAVPP